MDQNPSSPIVSDVHQTQTPEQSPPSVNKPRWPNILAVILVLLIVLFTGWLIYLRSYANRLTSPVTDLTPSVNRVKTAGKIIIGTDPTFAPMEFIDDANQYAGYDIDLGNRIAEKLGVQPEFKTIIFDDFIKEITSGNVDIVISAVTITDERKKQVLFSNAYLNAGQVIITNKDNSSVSTTKDLQGKKIAVQKGTTNEEKAVEFTDPTLVLRFDNFEEATEALLSGTADAIFADLTGAKGIVSANQTLKVASDPFTNEQYGVVAKLGEDDMVKEINSILNGLRQQGVLTFLKQKWLD